MKQLINETIRMAQTRQFVEIGLPQLKLPKENRIRQESDALLRTTGTQAPTPVNRLRPDQFNNDVILIQDA
jgi:hypothetical protein